MPEGFAYLLSQFLRAAVPPGGIEEYLVVVAQLKGHPEQVRIIIVIGHPGDSDAVRPQSVPIQVRQDESPCGALGGLPGISPATRSTSASY
jgi:hypothetical protein